MKDYASMTENELDAELIVEEAIIESIKGGAIVKSKEFWKAVRIG